MSKSETRELCTREVRNINDTLTDSGSKERLRVSYPSSNTSIVTLFSGTYPKEQQINQVSLHTCLGELLEWLTGFRYGLSAGMEVPIKESKVSVEQLATEAIDEEKRAFVSLCNTQVEEINNTLIGAGIAARVRLEQHSNNLLDVLWIRADGKVDRALKRNSSPENMHDWLFALRKGVNLGVTEMHRMSTLRDKPTPSDKAAEHLKSIEESLEDIRCQVANERSSAHDWADVADLERLAKSFKEAISQFVDDEDYNDRCNTEGGSR